MLIVRFVCKMWNNLKLLLPNEYGGIKKRKGWFQKMKMIQ